MAPPGASLPHREPLHPPSCLQIRNPGSLWVLPLLILTYNQFKGSEAAPLLSPLPSPRVDPTTSWPQPPLQGSHVSWHQSPAEPTSAPHRLQNQVGLKAAHRPSQPPPAPPCPTLCSQPPRCAVPVPRPSHVPSLARLTFHLWGLSPRVTSPKSLLSWLPLGGPYELQPPWPQGPPLGALGMWYHAGLSPGSTPGPCNPVQRWSLL